MLYDGREESPTRGRIMELHAGDPRPAFLVLPPGVWHGLHNIASTDALMVNFPSRPYDYDDPDHYRLPYDAEEIPYVWKASAGARFRADAR